MFDFPASGLPLRTCSCYDIMLLSHAQWRLIPRRGALRSWFIMETRGAALFLPWMFPLILYDLHELSVKAGDSAVILASNGILFHDCLLTLPHFYCQILAFLARFPVFIHTTVCCNKIIICVHTWNILLVRRQRPFPPSYFLPGTYLFWVISPSPPFLPPLNPKCPSSTSWSRHQLWLVTDEGILVHRMKSLCGQRRVKSGPHKLFVSS